MLVLVLWRLNNMFVKSIETYEEFVVKIEICEQLAIAEAQQECGDSIDGFSHLEALKEKLYKVV